MPSYTTHIFGSNKFDFYKTTRVFSAIASDLGMFADSPMPTYITIESVKTGYRVEFVLKSLQTNRDRTEIFGWAYVPVPGTPDHLKDLRLVIFND